MMYLIFVWFFSVGWGKGLEISLQGLKNVIEEKVVKYVQESLKKEVVVKKCP